MSTQIEKVLPGTSVRECAHIMNKTGIGALPVWEDGRLVGMITDRDVCCRAVGDDRDPATMTAREIMSGELSSCFEDVDCAEAARLMKTKGLRRLPVRMIPETASKPSATRRPVIGERISTSQDIQGTCSLNRSLLRSSTWRKARARVPVLRGFSSQVTLSLSKTWWMSIPNG